MIAAVALGVARSPRYRADPWSAAAVLLVTYVLITPWYLPWHLLGPLVLTLVGRLAPLRAGTLTFSGTSLFVGSGGTAWGLALQATVRYLPPALAAFRWRGRGTPSRAGDHRPLLGPGAVSDDDGRGRGNKE